MPMTTGLSSNKTWTLVLTGLLLVSLGACKSQKSSSEEDDKAQAVEADEEKAEKSDEEKKAEKKEGAAAKKADEDKGEKEAPKKATVGKPAPDFTLVDTKGNEHSLADLEGNVVVLEWTSTECPYVVRHYDEGTMPKTLEKLGGTEKVKWLSIDSSHFASAKASKKWKKKYEYDYPVLLDKEGKVGKMYEAKTTPHMYVIDKEGVLRYAGAIDDDPKGDKKRSERTNYVIDAVKALQDGEKVEKKTTKPYGCSVKYEG